MSNTENTEDLICFRGITDEAAFLCKGHVIQQRQDKAKNGTSPETFTECKITTTTATATEKKTTATKLLFLQHNLQHRLRLTIDIVDDNLLSLTEFRLILHITHTHYILVLSSL